MMTSINQGLEQYGQRYIEPETKEVVQPETKPKETVIEEWPNIHFGD